MNETSNVLPLPAMECLGGGENWSAYGHSDEAMLAYAEARAKVAVSAAIKKFRAELPKLLEETYMEGAMASKAALEMAVEMLGEKVVQLEVNDRRYRWLRERQWNTASLFVIAGGKSAVRLGTDCPFRDRLDAMIDAEIAAEKGGAA